MSDSDKAAMPVKLVSEVLREDREIRDLVEVFVNGLADRAAELREAHQQLDWGRLARLAHQLKGAGGSFGYPDLSGLGATMEKAFRAGSAGQFETWMEQFAQLAIAARAGLQDG